VPFSPRYRSFPNHYHNHNSYSYTHSCTLAEAILWPRGEFSRFIIGNLNITTVTTHDLYNVCMIPIPLQFTISTSTGTAGFILPPSWLLGRRARPRRGGRAERSGGLAISPPAPGTARIRSQNFLISIIYRVRATGGLTKEERGRRIISQKISDSSHLV
jgi:hypothetical protein